MQGTMVWCFEGRLVVAVHTNASPSNGDWLRFVNDATRVGVDGGFRLFVVSHGGGPNGEQRRALTESIHKHHPRMAMLTDSAMVRALMFAFSFINRTSQVLGLDDNDAAFDFLDLDGTERETACRLRRKLEKELGLSPKGPVSAHSAAG